MCGSGYRQIFKDWSDLSYTLTGLVTYILFILFTFLLQIQTLSIPRHLFISCSLKAPNTILYIITFLFNKVLFIYASVYYYFCEHLNKLLDFWGLIIIDCRCLLVFGYFVILPC